jgi:hypothetical protein
LLSLIAMDLAFVLLIFGIITFQDIIKLKEGFKK